MTIKEIEVQLALGTLSTNDKMNLAMKRNTPKWVLTALSKDKDSEVRSRVAYNPGTPVEILKILSKDKNWWVGHCAMVVISIHYRSYNGKQQKSSNEKTAN